MLNRELLLRTVKHIKDNPEKHDQSAFRGACGSTYCFAGWAVVLHTGQAPEDKHLSYPGATTWWVDKDTGKLSGTPYSGYGNSIPVSDYAQKILGLTEIQADRLFYRSESKTQVYGYVRALLSSAGNED